MAEDQGFVRCTAVLTVTGVTGFGMPNEFVARCVLPLGHEGGHRTSEFGNMWEWFDARADVEDEHDDE